MTFAERLQVLRKEMGLSQENLAEAVGVSRQAVSKWESGQSYPEMDKLIILSELFHVSIDSMVKNENATHSENTIPDHLLCNLKSRMHYEYKSKRMIGNMPLVHINVGFGVHVAKGFLAIGNIAIGCISLGLIALGGICVGALGLGIISLAALAFGLLFSAAGIAIGAIAVGGVSIGVIALGGLSIGMFSFGGCAIASHIAIGGYANGHIAIGDTAKGLKTIIIQDHNFNSVKAEQVGNLIHQEYPDLWKPITDWITNLFN